MSTTEKSSKKTTARGEPIVKYIYIGPNIKGGKLIKYTIYKGMPEYYKDLFEKMPELRQLFVPLSYLAAAEREAALVGTPKNKYYQMAKVLEV